MSWHHRHRTVWLSSATALAVLTSPLGTGSSIQAQEGMRELIRLPAARREGPVSVEQALTQRRSARSYTSQSLSLEEVAQVLWAAQGVTRQSDAPTTWRPQWQWMGGLRTAPSAGALYPIELYLVAGAVDGLAPGLYRYVPLEHSLEFVRDGDLRASLSEASLRQRYMSDAPATIIVSGVFRRSAVKYGERAPRYVHIEVGAVGQNIYLQAESLGLCTLFVGAFDDAAVQRALGLPADHEPLGIMPVGRRTQ